METKAFIIAIVGAVFASGGFWAFVQFVVERKLTRKSAENKALLGLLHDRIYALCNVYIERGYITANEHRNLMALYEPYANLGGNSTAKALKEEVDTLPMKGE